MVKIDYQNQSGITFRSLTGYQFAVTQYKADLDGTALVNFTFGDDVPVQLWSQEFDILSPDQGFITWTVGAYLDTLKYWFPRTYPGPYKFYIDTPPGSIFSEYLLQGANPEQHEAVFGQFNFNLSPQWQFQLGGRYTHANTKNEGNVLQYGTFINIGQSAEFSNFSGKASLNWTADQNNFLYGFVSTGFRPGGLNVPVGFGLPAPFKEEKIIDFELGWKNISLGGHLRSQFDAFYDNYDNFQVTVGYPTFPTFGFELNVPNTTHIYGVEAQAQASFGDLSFDAGVAWMQSSLGRFFAHDPRFAGVVPCDPSSGPASATCLNLTGNEQTYAPDFTFNASAEYKFHLSPDDTLTPRISFGHVSRQWATLFENPALGDRIAARDILGGQLAWTHGDIVTTLYVTNATDQHYVGALNSGLRFEGPPRQYGIRVMKGF
jgi:iron complex outermembrane receptor protein